MPRHMPMTPIYTKKNNYIKITLKKYTYKPENTLVIPFHTKKKNHVKKHTRKTHTLKHAHNLFFMIKKTFKSNNSHKNHRILTISIKNHYILTTCILTILIKNMIQT